MAKASSVDFLVMGAGVAGLRAAVELARHGDVLVVTKESVGESNTHYAQGGIAVAMEGAEDVALHLEDTVNAGDGLVYRPAAEALVNEGPLRVAELIEWGANFDRESGPADPSGGQFLRTREGAHSLARILHAHGDATGAEISRALLAFTRTRERIRFAEWTRVAGLVVADGRAIAADLASAEPSRAELGDAGRKPRTRLRVAARSILVASGGAGQVYSDTTNPAVATGDGIALAVQAGAPNDRSSSLGWEANAELADMEFYQFHPTALALPGVPRFLLSEALRGEGAYLRNDRGERFMERYHPLLELAPRDVVARAIAREAMLDRAAHLDPAAPHGSAPQPRLVYLDMRHVRNLDLAARFPGISAFLAQYGLDLRRDLIPVRPAAHYLMGGIRTDLGGRTSLAGLYAAGEAACTGVHGANRLASNSLLEGLVFGARAARSMLSDSLPLVSTAASADAGPALKHLTAKEQKRVEGLIAALRASMWTHAGLLREESSLLQGLAAQAACEAALAEVAAGGRSSRRLAETQAMCRVARAILISALARTESRGAHFRSDYPRRDDQNFQNHSVIGRDGQVRFEEW
ncbi:MAG: L-aspartate oxidase [Terracidiphilus sp.]|jgi:L-aspartate oxidase